MLILHYFRVALVPVCAAVLACPMLLAQQKVVVDPARSEVHFTLGAVLHTVHGTFQMERGEVSFNAASGQASGSLVVDASSGHSGNSVRDRRMADEVLKMEHYKDVTFTPMRFSGTFHASGDSSLVVHGLFTILGTGHEIDVPMRIQMNGVQMHATGAFSVPFVQWGLKDPSTMMLRVQKEVQVKLLLVGTLQP